MVRELKLDKEVKTWRIGCFYRFRILQKSALFFLYFNMLDLMLVIYGTEVEDLSFDTILLPFTYTSRNGSQSDYKFESTVNINSYLLKTMAL